MIGCQPVIRAWRCGLSIANRPRTDLESKRQGASQTQIRTGAVDASSYIRSNTSGTGSWTSLVNPGAGNRTRLDVP